MLRICYNYNNGLNRILTMMTMSNYRQGGGKGCFVALLMLLAINMANAETVRLADCPEEPDVFGTFYNNGKKCVRDPQTIPRHIIPVECPDGFEYRSGVCRKRHEKSVKPQCPDAFQRVNGNCHSDCPAPYKTNYADCTLGRATLDPRYMTCPEGMHRYNAYCCTPGVHGDCPQIECIVGDGTDIPGKFYYDPDTGFCERQPQALARTTSVRRKPKPGNMPNDPNKRCPDDKVLVWGVCQDKCPDEFQALKGMCILRRCRFDAATDNIVDCPEGKYVVWQAMI